MTAVAILLLVLAVASLMSGTGPAHIGGYRPSGPNAKTSPLPPPPPPGRGGGSR